MALRTAIQPVIIVALVALSFWQANDIRSLRKDLSASVSNIASLKERIASSTLEHQQRCSDQAHKTFKEMGFTDGSPLAAYQNHFNTKMDRCFIDVTNTAVAGPVVVTVRNLFDAFEGREYGTYLWRNPGNKKYWEVEPSKCQVIQPSGEVTQCRSDEEFTSLSKIYMDN